MALYNCPECSSPVSQYAESCPHCGFPMKEYKEWIEKLNDFGYDILRYNDLDAIPVKVLINSSDKYPIEYEGVYLTQQERLYAYNKLNKYVLTGVVNPSVGVYLARVEKKDSLPMLYIATAKEDGKLCWYYGDCSEGKHPANNDGLSYFDSYFQIRKCAVKVMFNCGENIHGVEMTDMLDTIRAGYNLNTAFLKGIEEYDVSYKNYVDKIYQEYYYEDFDQYRNLDDC